MSFGEEQARTNRALEEASARASTGTCVGYGWAAGLTQVNVGGSVLSMPWAGDAPWIGETVRVIWVGGQPIAIAAHGSAMGTVQSVTSNIATVTGDDGRTYLYPVATGLTVSAGHRVRLDHGGRLVSVRYAAEPPGSAFEVPPAPPSSGGSATFVPTASGSYRDGVFRSGQVEVNEFRVGVYWYGEQIAGTIPDSAAVTRMEIRLTEEYDQQVGPASRLGTHTQASPSGEPSIIGSIDVDGSGAYSILPFATALKTGAALGVGFQLGYGYRGFSAAPAGGQIYAEWTA